MDNFDVILFYVIVPSFLLLNNLLCSMNRGADGFKVNTQSHLLPVLATSIKVILQLHKFSCFFVFMCCFIYFN